MSLSKGKCFDSDNESQATSSEAESGDELVVSSSKKMLGECDKQGQIVSYQTVSS
jgi:hypothetical protein